MIKPKRLGKTQSFYFSENLLEKGVTIVDNI